MAMPTAMPLTMARPKPTQQHARGLPELARQLARPVVVTNATAMALGGGRNCGGMTKRDSSSHATSTPMCVAARMSAVLRLAAVDGHAALPPSREQRPQVLAHGGKLPAGANGVGLARPGQVDADLLQDAARPRAHHQDAVGEENGLVHVVGDEHHGLRRLREDDGNLALQLLPGDGVERAKRLIEQQHVGIKRERPGEADALLHAAGQFVRIVADEALEPDEPHEALGALLDLRGRQLRHLQPEGDVAGDGQPGKQVELLKHHRARRRRRLHALA